MPVDTTGPAGRLELYWKERIERNSRCGCVNDPQEEGDDGEGERTRREGARRSWW